jgi:biotin-dependent carboxylase-like uncharacterized protein
MSFKVIVAGLQTLIVDAGRTGYRKFGIPSSGAMDSFSYRAANILAGNPESFAALEINLAAPEIAFLSDALIAVTGADFSPEINSSSISMWESRFVENGDILSFGAVKAGCRAYVAFHGGIDVPAVMGAKTTFARAGIGGLGGRALRPGDIVGICASDMPLSLHMGRRLRPSLIPVYENMAEIRVIIGPNHDYFTDKGIRTFLNESYTVTNQFDRMGYRLDGPAIETKAGSDIISEGIVTGSVQIPGGGKPIIIMEDGQTAGGYAKIATVISSDLPKVAQAKTGDILRFQSVSLHEARRILIQTELSVSKNAKFFRAKYNGKFYDITIQEV